MTAGDQERRKRFVIERLNELVPAAMARAVAHSEFRAEQVFAAQAQHLSGLRRRAEEADEEARKQNEERRALRSAFERLVLRIGTDEAQTLLDHIKEKLS